MTRRRVHLLFGAAALAFGLVAAWDGWRLVQAQWVNEAIASAEAGALDASLPEARFARAVALARAGDVEGAAKAYKALIQEDRRDLKRAALFNLGNLHLREALKLGGGSSTLPLLELAKQGYRDLLRDDPMDWDGRYNLERALWLAPELDPQADEEDNVPQWERRVAPQAQGFVIELP
jgi:mxaK protein